jgi:hypothetical protein
MATSKPLATAAQAPAQTALRPGTPILALWFDALIACLGLWVTAGLFLDGWYHNSFQDSVESFMSPWHGLLYSGVLLSGFVLVAAYVRHFRLGYHWRRALPPHYFAALGGFFIFGVSGLLDFAWHSVFGFEFDVEALLSPPHLALAASMAPLVLAPFRAAWLRPTGRAIGWGAWLPVVLSILLTLSVFTFFTQFANLFTHPNVFSAVSGGYYREVAGIASVLIPTALTMTFVLLAMRRWALPPGSLTLLITLNAAAMYVLSMAYSGQHWPILLAALAGGLAGDALLVILKPSVQRPAALRVFAFAVPLVLNLLYFVALLALGRLDWRIHLWLGTAVLSGITGFGLSLLVAPPTLPAEAEGV